MTQAQTLAKALNALAKSPQFNYSKARATARQDGNVNQPATKARNEDFNAEVDGCDYCLSAHSYIAKNLAKLDDVEIEASRNGSSHDPKAASAVRFAVKIVRERGHVSDADVAEARGKQYREKFILANRLM